MGEIQLELFPYKEKFLGAQSLSTIVIKCCKPKNVIHSATHMHVQWEFWGSIESLPQCQLFQIEEIHQKFLPSRSHSLPKGFCVFPSSYPWEFSHDSAWQQILIFMVVHRFVQTKSITQKSSLIRRFQLWPKNVKGLFGANMNVQATLQNGRQQ